MGGREPLSWEGVYPILAGVGRELEEVGVGRGTHVMVVEKGRGRGTEGREGTLSWLGL